MTTSFFYRFALSFVFITLVFCADAQKTSKNFTELVRNAANDSIKITLLFEWDNEIYIENPQLDIKINNEIIAICRHRIKTEKKSRFYQESLAKSLNNKGLAQTEKNKLDEALELLQESYEISKKIGLKETEGFTSNNMGTIYRSMKEHEKAIEYYSKSLAITKDSSETPETFNNIGLCYMDLKNYSLAYKYFKTSLRFSNNPNHFLNKANSLLNLADMCMEEKKYDEAMSYFTSSLETNNLISNYHGISYSYCGLSELFLKRKQYDKAIQYGKMSLDIATKQDLLYDKKEACYQLYQTYKEKKDFVKALKYFEQHQTFNKEYTDLTNKEEVIRKEYAFEYKNKEELATTKHRKEMEVAAEKNKRQRIIISFIILAFIGFLVFLFFVIKSYRKTKKMNALIAIQKREVELKNQEILDSISYAKRIQTAILPTDEYFKSKFKESFILYLPKDIVAGDFYWMEEKDNLLIFAVADCTGHGVPGAMVSVVCHNALNRCVREFNLTKPNEILNKAREIIINEFEKSNEEMKDGMDISLCCLDMDTLQLKWAGANNPFCVVRNKELIEFKADKQPIGNFAHATDFTMHEIQMLKNDLIYLFSDGYVDQFGGENADTMDGKKYKSKRLKSLLIELSDQEIEKQKTILKNDFLKWKGKLDQVDDICIIGIRV